jgi:hypothetical protein
MGRGAEAEAKVGRAEKSINADSDLDPHPR